LKFKTINTKTITRDSEQVETVPFTLVNEVLDSLFEGQTEKLLIRKKSCAFRYTPDTDLDTATGLTTTVQCDNITKTNEEIEINLSGTIVNQQGKQDTCSLYFFLWWDSTAISLGKNFNCNNAINGPPIQVNTMTCGEALSDSLFELDLLQRSESGEPQVLGQGRGYMVFGHQT